MNFEEFADKYSVIFRERFGRTEKFFTPRDSHKSYIKNRELVGSMKNLFSEPRMYIYRKRHKYNKIVNAFFDKVVWDGWRGR